MPPVDRARGAPDRETQKVPLRTRRSFTRGTPRGLLTRGLLGSMGFMAAHSNRRILAQIRAPVWEFESQASGKTQRSWRGPVQG